jgi:hypothetical protein
MFEKYDQFIQSILRSYGRQYEPFRVSIVGNHLVLTMGVGFNTAIVFFDLDNLENILYMYPRAEPSRDVVPAVHRKYQLDDVE